MARKTATITITDEGRDKGKTFVLKEMPAAQAERLAVRAFLALSRAGVEIPEDVAQSGLAGIYMMGFRMLGGMNFDDADLILKEMFGCVSITPSTGIVRALIDTGGDGDDIEEVTTRFQLRKEILRLHMDFFSPGAGSTLTSETKPTGV